MRPGKKVEYTIYRKGTDELVAMGPPAVCAKILGVTVPSLHSIVSRAIRGKHGRYEIFKDEGEAL